MVQRYIKIKYLCARIPFSECLIQFVIKKRQEGPTLFSEIQFYSKRISYEIDENIQLVCSQKHTDSLAIYLMAINKDNRVSCIGFVPLNLSQLTMNRKQKLLGLEEQSGYIIFCMQEEPFADMQHLVNVKLSNSSIQSSKLSTSRKAHTHEAVKPFSTNRVEEQKTLLRTKDREKASQAIEQRLTKDQALMRNDLATVKVDVYEEQWKINEHDELQKFYIELLKHKIKNSQYFETIRKNYQFLNKHKQIYLT